ncbi:MAG: c-type cytochrome [Nitrospirales bacterium]|nr:c-type cytochrome [Nitrospirales bacterium]
MRCNPSLLKIYVILLLCGILPGGIIGNDHVKAESVSFPHDPATFQPGAGSSIASGYCTMCHSAEYVYMQPPHNRDQWAEIVDKMRHSFGCPIPDEHVSQLVDYLVSQNSLQFPAFSNRANMGSSSRKSEGGNPNDGRKLYSVHCVNCHGSGGKGDGPIGQALLPPPADLTAAGNKSDEELLKTIQKGRPGTAMPSWEHDLSAQDIDDLLAYLRVLSRQE